MQQTVLTSKDLKKGCVYERLEEGLFTKFIFYVIDIREDGTTPLGTILKNDCIYNDWPFFKNRKYIQLA